MSEMEHSLRGLTVSIDASGKYIYVCKTHFGIGPREIWMYHVDGGTGVQITKSKPTPTTKREDQTNDMGVVASSDGKYLYYAERRRDFSYNSMFPLWRIKRKDRKTGDEDVIIEQPESTFRSRKSWSRCFSGTITTRRRQASR